MAQPAQTAIAARFTTGPSATRNVFNGLEPGLVEHLAERQFVLQSVVAVKVDRFNATLYEPRPSGQFCVVTNLDSAELASLIMATAPRPKLPTLTVEEASELIRIEDMVLARRFEEIPAFLERQRAKDNDFQPGQEG